MTRLPVASLGLLSAASLAYEVLLMRLFSIIHWHHFAYMVIGLALLGYGFSGSAVLLLQTRIMKYFTRVYFANIVLFSLFSLISFQWAQNISFNAEEILWDWRQGFYLLLIFLLLSLPFFFVGAAICLAFLAFKQSTARLYAADLLGAGAGCLGFVLMLYAVFPQSALIVVGLCGLLAAIAAGLEAGFVKTRLTVICLIILALVGWGGGRLQLNVSPYKSLSQMLLIQGSGLIAEKSGPLGMISVLSNDRIPFRYAPGMSFTSGSEPLLQLAVFTDADNMSVITQKPERLEQLSYLDQMTSALPYHLAGIERVLVIGSGGGADVLQAQYHRVDQIDAVELNEQLVALTELHHGDFISDIYRQPGVSVHITDGRDFLNSHRQRYSLIQLNLLDSFSASAAGLYALNESYLYTVEALQLYLSKLEAGGYLAITRWLKMPPRDTLKLFNTALTALQYEHPERQIILIRSWQTATLVIKNGVISPQEIEIVEAFAGQRNFDLVYTPSIRPDQVNRFNVLSEPLFYQATQALLGDDKRRFIENYKFNLQPATDDRPYFQHFFRWSSLPEIIGLLHKGGASLIETGYLIVLATLVIAVITSIVLILGPLLWLKRKMVARSDASIKRWRVFGYFFAIGLAFLMIEIAFMQKFVLFLHHPVYSAAVTLTAFLVFAGFGSASSDSLGERCGRHIGVIYAVVGILVFCIVYLSVLPAFFVWAGAFPLLLRFVLAILLIAPLAFFMGMPMPLALGSLADHCAGLIPWAWGINGCASVISSVLTALLSMQFGFSIVVQAAILLYVAVVFMFPGPVSLGELFAKSASRSHH